MELELQNTQRGVDTGPGRAVFAKVSSQSAWNFQWNDVDESAWSWRVCAPEDGAGDEGGGAVAEGSARPDEPDLLVRNPNLGKEMSAS